MTYVQAQASSSDASRFNQPISKDDLQKKFSQLSDNLSYQDLYKAGIFRTPNANSIAELLAAVNNNQQRQRADGETDLAQKKQQSSSVKFLKGLAVAGMITSVFGAFALLRTKHIEDNELGLAIDNGANKILKPGWYLPIALFIILKERYLLIVVPFYGVLLLLLQFHKAK